MNANASRIARIKLREQGSYMESMKEYCEKYVMDSYKNDFFKLMNIENLTDNLSQTERMVWRYECIPNQQGHHCFEVQIIRINETCFDGKAMMVFRHIDDIVSAEQSYQQKLQTLAYQDALTKLGNRAAFMGKLSECEKDADVSCIMADVNNLKSYNDQYGHQKGDRIITGVAECIRRSFGDKGDCYRIGGDEFCVIMQNGGEKEIKTAIRQFDILVSEMNQMQKETLSVAVGYAIRKNPDESMEQIFNRADQNMYEGKCRMKMERGNEKC